MPGAATSGLIRTLRNSNLLKVLRELRALRATRASVVNASTSAANSASSAAPARRCPQCPRRPGAPLPPACAEDRSCGGPGTRASRAEPQLLIAFAVPRQRQCVAVRRRRGSDDTPPVHVRHGGRHESECSDEQPSFHGGRSYIFRVSIRPPKTT